MVFLKQKKNKASLMLCSVITTSAIGVSQVSSSTSSALFSSLGQKIKESAKCAAGKTWDGIKEVANYLWKNEKTVMFSALAVGSASLFPKATVKFLTGIGEAIKGGVTSLGNLTPGIREVVAMTILIVGFKAYQKWDNWRVDQRAEEKIKKDAEKTDQLIKKDLEKAEQMQKMYDNYNNKRRRGWW